MKKNDVTKLCALSLCALCTQLSPARQLYLAPDGSSTTGTSIEQPFGNVQTAFSALTAGDTLWVRGGKYLLSATIQIKACGTNADRICAFAYPNERPVFDFSGYQPTESKARSAYRGFLHNIGADYWHYRGLDFTMAADNGMKMEGSYNVVELCNFYKNGDTGYQEGFIKDDDGNNTGNPKLLYGRYNIVINCDAYDNYDTQTGGGNSDGFACKLFPGPGNEFHGCRAWDNSDDGWDMYKPVFPVVIESCWAIHNGYANGQEAGNGNGIKFGGLKQGGTSVGAHIMMNDISAYNLSKGFDQNHHQEGSFMFNCLSFENHVNYAFDMESPTYGKWVLRNCIGLKPNEANHRFNSINDIDISNCNWIDIDKLSPVYDCAGGNAPDGTKYNKYTHEKWPDYSGEFESITYEDAIAPRQANGELPLKFGRLKAGSQFIDKGTPITNFLCTDKKDKPDYSVLTDHQDYSSTITLPYTGKAPDYGPFEYGADSTPTAISTASVNNGSQHEMYSTNNGLIVYGDIKAIDVYNANGVKVAASQLSQFVNLAAAGSGVRIVVITDKNGNKTMRKFIRK
jgi:hypothetical protein